MGIEVNWSPEAVEDLESIAEYIARDSQFYARSVVAEVLAAAGALSIFPRMGRVVPEIGDEKFRERFIYSYRLIYRIENDNILIVAVIHGKRLLEQIHARFE